MKSRENAMRMIVLSLLVVLVFVFGIGIGDRLSTYKHKAVIVSLQGQANIFRNEALRYAKILRTIQEAASQAIAIKKVQ